MRKHHSRRRRFLRRADSLLWSTTGEELRDKSIIDLHEQVSADWYRDLAQHTARNLQGASGYWTDPKLLEAREIRDRRVERSIVATVPSRLRISTLLGLLYRYPITPASW